MWITARCKTCAKYFTWWKKPSKKDRIYCSRKCSGTLHSGWHGDSYSRLYMIWESLKTRCGKKKNYLDVSICAEWATFEPFRDWSLANGYADDLEIDRIQGSKIYSPATCRWTNQAQQQRNVGKRQKETASSKYKGVHKASKSTYSALSSISGKYLYLGSFPTEEAAARAYDDHVFKYDPEHAYLNFPERLRPSVQELV